MVESSVPNNAILTTFQMQYYETCYEEDLSVIRLSLSELGAELLEYIPHNTWTVYMSAATALEIQKRYPDVVRWVGEFLPRDRFVPEMITLLSSSETTAKDIPGIKQLLT